MSGAVPGPKTTIRRVGRDGYACARARRESAGSATAPAAKRRKLRRGSFTALSPIWATLVVRNQRDAHPNTLRFFHRSEKGGAIVAQGSSVAIAGHSRPKDGVASLAYDPAIHLPS